MSTVHEPPATAAEQYAQAHAIHDPGRDLRRAPQASGQIIESHPRAAGAGYARSQTNNIVNLVVPAGELLTSRTALALRHLRRDGDDAATAVVA